MKTRITDIFNIEYPIFQGGMAWVAEYNLAAAVSEVLMLTKHTTAKTASKTPATPIALEFLAIRSILFFILRPPSPIVVAIEK